VEGEKLVDELLHSDTTIVELYATSKWINSNHQLITEQNIDINTISDIELNKISSLTTPNKVLAVAKQRSFEFKLEEISNELSIFLENINDPGNLGTIIRIADWFGIKNIFCTNESVDLYNPKVIQSSMGAIYRTKVHYIDTTKFLSDLNDLENYNIYGTFLEGNNIYKEDLGSNGLIIMGNESHGISNSIRPLVNKKLFIPNFPLMDKTSESLNISTATAIVCSEFRRRVS
jgi:TrmH family RNA methyltransferase